MQDRKLGALGEKEFERLCIAGGLTINKSFMDETGWDFLLEFPWRSRDNCSQDLLLAPLECKVQVKSTDKRRKREQVALSNLQRLVKTPIPVFFCFLEFDGKNEVQAIYMVHVDESIIKKTLKKIRKLESEGFGNKLNRRKLDITYGDSDRLSELTGESIKNAIEKKIPDGMEKYVKDKNNISETVGFENGRYQIEFTIVDHDPIRKILDASLGIREKINVYKTTGYDIRFGIPGKNKKSSYGEELSIHVITRKAKIKFKAHTFSPGIEFEAKLYVPPINEFIPRERAEARLKSSFFDFTININEVKCTVTSCPGEKFPLRELDAFIELLSLIKNSRNSILVELEIENLHSSPIFCFNPKETNPDLLIVEDLNGHVFDWESISETSKKIERLCRRINLKEELIHIQVKDLLGIQHSGDFQIIYEAFCGRAESVALCFSDQFIEFPSGAQVATIVFARTHIGDHFFCCCLGVIGSLSWSNAQQILTGEKILIGKQFMGTHDMNLKKESIESSLKELREELVDRGSFIIYNETLRQFKFN